MTLEESAVLIQEITRKGFGINDVETRALIKLMSFLFKKVCLDAGYHERQIRAVTTKFRDAGRRSAPWRPTSSRVPGRPQDGSDGNRINRWLLEEDHKFYATEVVATLVEVKYFLQTLSMENAPQIPNKLIETIFTPWLIEHDILPGAYLDPVQLIKIDFVDFINNPRSVQSGHIFPLDRGGRHQPDNTFLMLYRSNQMQGNQTVAELIEIMREIIERHDEAKTYGSHLEELIQKQTA